MLSKNLYNITLSILVFLGMTILISEAQSSMYFSYKTKQFISFGELVQQLHELENSSEFVNLEVIGKSVEQKDIHLVVISKPEQLSLTGERKKCITLFMAQQHGNEPATTDACINFIKHIIDNAYNVLDSQTILVMPMVNPDGAEIHQRENIDGVDINRDYILLSSPEARAVQKVLNRWHPHVVIDHHEYQGVGIPWLPIRIYDFDLTTMYPNNKNIEPVIKKASKKFIKNWISSAIRKAGYTAASYGVITSLKIPVVANLTDPSKARNYMGLNNCITVLSESNMQIARGIRIYLHELIMRTTIEYVQKNCYTIKNTVQRAKENAVIKGRNMEGLIFLGKKTIEPPWGYIVDFSSKNLIKNLKLHNISMEMLAQDMEIEGGYYISGSFIVKMAQPKRTLISMLLDKNSPYRQLSEKDTVRIKMPLQNGF